MKQSEPVIRIDPEIMGRTAVFVGTRAFGRRDWVLLRR
jgi:hypothetical protein